MLVRKLSTIFVVVLLTCTGSAFAGDADREDDWSQNRVYRSNEEGVTTRILSEKIGNLSNPAATDGCSTDGSITVTKIDPPLGTVLQVGESYTFSATASYQFKNAKKGTVGILAADTNSYHNLDNQSQNDATAKTKKGKAVVSVTTDISLNGDAVNIVGIITPLFPDGNSCTTVTDDRYYVTSEGSGISAFPLDTTYGKTDIEGHFAETLNGKRHTGVDIMAPENTLVYAVCNGTVVLNNTKKKYATAYLSYWNSFLVIKHNCNGMVAYGYYGHVDSDLEVSESVWGHDTGTLPVPIGTVRASYDKKNKRSKDNDHLHFGFSHNYLTSGWGYAKLSETRSSLLQGGWFDPETFFAW